jgi:hypothetical protein
MGTTTNYSWPIPEDTDLVKDGAEAIRDLGNAIDTSAADFGGGLVHINTTSFSAVASQSINDVFSATYNNYKIVFDLDSTSAGSTGIAMRLRVAGADNSSANYWNNRLFGQATSTTSQGATSEDTSFILFGERDTGVSTFDYNLYNPFATKATSLVGTGQFRYTSAYQHSQLKTGQTTVTTSYTGFTLITSTGTMTGKVIIYGYNE